MSRNFLGLQDIEDEVEILGTTVYETEVNSNEQIQMNSNSKTDDQPLTIQRFREDGGRMWSNLHLGRGSSYPGRTGWTTLKKTSLAATKTRR